MKRVVITGMGPVTPIGIGEAAFARAQREGRSGIVEISRFDAAKYPARMAGEIRDDLSGFLDAREARRLDRFVQLALIGAQFAVADSGLSEAELAGERSGAIIGTGVGGMETWEEQSTIAALRGASRVSPLFIPMIICNMASGHIAMRYRLLGPSSTVVTACASGSGAVGDAFRTVQLGLADVMLAGGAEAAITPMSIGSFGNMKALSGRNDSPATASRPFTASRDGFVLGEGAGVLVLEELEHARARGARIHAELVGYGTSADAFHITMPAPEGRGAQVAMRAALASASLNPE
ncbi:MAG: beta-ketoacyl synthase N-terminal-like domain-containing protein, partial [Deinococcus sp.]